MTLSAAELGHLLKSATITVGDGRGFVVQGTSDEYATGRYVVTAAWCLSHLTTTDVSRLGRFDLILQAFVNPAAINTPPPSPLYSIQGALNAKRPVLGVLGEKPTVCATCIFLDLKTGIVVMSSHQDREAYDALTASVAPLRLSDAAKWSRWIDDDKSEAEAQVWLLSFTRYLIACTARYSNDFVGNEGHPLDLRLRGGEIPQPEFGLPPRDPFYEGPEGAWAPYGMAILGSPIIVADGSVIGLLTGQRSGPRLREHLPSWLSQDLIKAGRATAKETRRKKS
jgi:hypothetical protein